jgi:hypothetical protein
MCRERLMHNTALMMAAVLPAPVIATPAPGSPRAIYADHRRMPLTRHQHSPSRALDALQPYFERVESRTHIRHLEADPDFSAIREDPRFKKMLAAAKERLGLHTIAE